MGDAALPLALACVAALAAVTSATVCSMLIRIARVRGWGQKVRDDGPASHLSKAGTPSMGGIAFVAVAALSALAMAVAGGSKAELMLTAGLATATLGLGAIGLWDDLTKIVSGRTRGVPARWRILAQFAVAAAAVALLDAAHRAGLPFGGFRPPLGLAGVSYPLAFAVRVAAVVGCANAVNFTDGVDGLAASTVSIALAAMAAVALACGLNSAALFSAVICGAAAGFLLYNWHPAQLFMGDVGSMTLGGALGALAVAVGAELLLVVLGAIFVLETLSVIGQVVSFQLTGRRILKMAPLHHHLELSGWRETSIVLAACAVQVGLAVLSAALAVWAVSGA